MKGGPMLYCISTTCGTHVHVLYMYTVQLNIARNLMGKVTLAQVPSLTEWGSADPHEPLDPPLG